MHRSGTSCLSGCLQFAGLTSDYINIYSKDNLKGNREHPLINKFNDKILALNKASWSQPVQDIKYTNEDILERNLIIKFLNNNNQIFYFKDPRTLLLLEVWKKNLDIIFVGTFRKPADVAASLFKREDLSISIKEGLNLWILYNKKLLDQYKKKPFPIIYFGGNPNDYKLAIQELIEYLNKSFTFKIPLEFTKENDFFSSTLISKTSYELYAETPEDSKLLAKAQKIYNELMLCAINPEVNTRKKGIKIPIYTDKNQLINIIDNKSAAIIHYKLLAKSYLKENDSNNALKYLKKALKKENSNLGLVQAICEILVLSSSMEKAFSFLDNTKYHNINPYQILEIKARVLFQSNKFDEFIIIQKKLVQLRPKNDSLLLRLIRVLYKVKKYEKLIEIGSKKIKFNKNNLQVIKLLGLSYKHNGKNTKAKKCLEYYIAHIYKKDPKIEEKLKKLKIK